MPGRDVGDGVDRNDPSGELITGDAGDAVAVLVLKDGSGELVATASIGPPHWCCQYELPFVVEFT